MERLIGDRLEFARAVLAGLVTNAITALVGLLIAVAGGWLTVGRGVVIAGFMFLAGPLGFYLSIRLTELVEDEHEEWVAPIGLASMIAFFALAGFGLSLVWR